VISNANPGNDHRRRGVFPFPGHPASGRLGNLETADNSTVVTATRNLGSARCGQVAEGRLTA